VFLALVLVLDIRPRSGRSRSSLHSLLRKFNITTAFNTSNRGYFSKANIVYLVISAASVLRAAGGRSTSEALPARSSAAAALGRGHWRRLRQDAAVSHRTARRRGRAATAGEGLLRLTGFWRRLVICESRFGAHM
jgi:hypothetical protein